MTQYRMCRTNEEALQVAMDARRAGKRSEIISDADYEAKRPKLSETQSLQKWAQDNGVEFTTRRT